MPPPETYVGVPPAVAFFKDVDLSVHVDTVAPAEGAVPVPAGSLPSSHKAMLPILKGLKAVTNGTKVNGIRVVVPLSNCAEGIHEIGMFGIRLYFDCRP